MIKEENKNNVTELVMILDRSGSMAGLESDTIGGFNSMIAKQKKEPGECYVSVVLFDDLTDVIYDRVDIHKVEQMNGNQYYVRGCTALLDALGGAIHHIGNVHKYARKEDVPSKTLFIIMTDGMENASRRYTYERVREMVRRQQEVYGWEFLFLGANIDAIGEASRFGIRANHAANFHNDTEGTKLNWAVMSSVVGCARASKSKKDMNAMFEEEALLSPIHKDFKSRKKKQ